jgi:hypothetical protein
VKYETAIGAGQALRPATLPYFADFKVAAAPGAEVVAQIS